MIAQRAQLFLSLVDSSDSIGNMSLWLADGVDLAAAAAGAATFRSVAAACTGAVFVRQSVVFSQVVAPRPEAPAGTDGTRVGLLIYSCDSDELALVAIPGVKSSLLMTAGPGAGLLIDQTNADVIALNTALIGSIWSNPFGFTLEALESAYLQIRR